MSRPSHFVTIFIILSSRDHRSYYKIHCHSWYWSTEWSKCWLQGCQEIQPSWAIIQQMSWVWNSWQQKWALLLLTGKHYGILESVYVLHLLITSVGRWGIFLSHICQYFFTPWSHFLKYTNLIQNCICMYTTTTLEKFFFVLFSPSSYLLDLSVIIFILQVIEVYSNYLSYKIITDCKQ
jgi:hypothetical protein